ncbi:MAG: hypothetical protein HY929_06120 [Euryarchaeota archaeon]|nr:hypothetical protein [Euryarchaeota archaeon]
MCEAIPIKLTKKEKDFLQLKMNLTEEQMKKIDKDIEERKKIPNKVFLKLIEDTLKLRMKYGSRKTLYGIE